MSNARTIIEGKIAAWQQALEQLAAQRRRLEAQMRQNEAEGQQHQGAILGARELLEMLPEPEPEVAPEAGTPDNKPVSDEVEGPG